MVDTEIDGPRVFEWLGRLGVPGLFDGRHRFELHPTNDGAQTTLMPQEHQEADVGRKVGLDLTAITDAAVEIVDSNGLDGATLSSVAKSLGVKVPSLYNHVSGLAGLRRLISLHAAERLGNQYERDVRALPKSADASTRLRAIANAHRRFAINHPGLYQSLLPAPLPGQDDELFAAMSQPVLVAVEAMTGHRVGADGRVPSSVTDDSLAIHRLRALRSLIHGFVDLELNGGFGLPVNMEESFNIAVDAVITGITE